MWWVAATIFYSSKQIKTHRWLSVGFALGSAIWLLFCRCFNMKSCSTFSVSLVSATRKLKARPHSFYHVALSWWYKFGFHPLLAHSFYTFRNIYALLWGHKTQLNKLYKLSLAFIYLISRIGLRIQGSICKVVMQSSFCSYYQLFQVMLYFTLKIFSADGIIKSMHSLLNIKRILVIGTFKPFICPKLLFFLTEKRCIQNVQEMSVSFSESWTLSFVPFNNFWMDDWNTWNTFFLSAKYGVLSCFPIYSLVS